MFIMQNAAIEMHWLMVNHVSRLKKAEKPKMLVWRTEFGRGVIFFGKLNKPCGYWFCQKWLLIISKRPKKSSEWCYFNLTPPTDHGTILRRSPLPSVHLSICGCLVTSWGLKGSWQLQPFEEALVLLLIRLCADWRKLKCSKIVLQSSCLCVLSLEN